MAHVRARQEVQSAAQAADHKIPRGRGHFSSTTNKVLDILEPELVELRVAAGDRITVVNGCSTIDEMMQQIKEGTHLRMCIEFCVEERARATVRVREEAQQEERARAATPAEITEEETKEDVERETPGKCARNDNWEPSLSRDTCRKWVRVALKEGWFCEVEPWGSLYDQRQHARG